jgi:ATP-dependent Clp protease protease subunit
MLLSYGDYRYVGTQASVMIHEITAGAYGNANDLKCDAKRIDRTNRHWMNWLAKNCGMRGYRQLKKVLTTENRNHWMSAKEAVAFGIADHVGMPKIISSTQYSLGAKGA